MSKGIKPLGTAFPSSSVVTPGSLCGQKVSLNRKICDYLRLPISNLTMDGENQTLEIPPFGEIDKYDLGVLWKNLKVGKIVMGDKPIPRFEKQRDVLLSNLDLLSSPHRNFATIREDIVKIVTGPNTIGGYNKLEMLEELLAYEKTGDAGKGGFKRPKVIELLEKAVTYVQEAYGGISRVSTEYEKRETHPSSSYRNIDNKSPIDVQKWWES